MIPAYLHLYRAFVRAMDTGRIEDAAALMEEACLPRAVIGHVLTDYYVNADVRPAVADAFRVQVV
jgi:hypothetical protein